MALTQVTGGRAQWWEQVRPGPGGTAYTGLVSDLEAGDFLCGMRCTVVSTGATVSGNRTLTLRRLATGFEFTHAFPAASSLLLVRPT